ncbi:ComEA family DNA-binding protein [Flavobacterium soli]|uniref:ComEA family DNA-binding protein n=1 Tax=Flavobacterium soli TaxID=344881 RepID=UPI000426CB82|nr:helix-hairpin-helix domain-containing protein [Flavobacterium soli]
MKKMFLKFSRIERNGIFMLLSIIIAIQLLYFFSDFSVAKENDLRKQKWIALQPVMDSLKKEKEDYVPKIYPFNPNFITDFKGYKLGMSVAEIDRLLAFRKTNKYVNSAQEFQQVTMVSDSLLKTMAPYFKFPDWVNNRKNKQFVDYSKPNFEKKQKTVVMDINQATQEDLIKVYGIGPALSERILKEKSKFGSFMTMDQIQHIWGLSPEVIENLNKHFEIRSIPDVKKLQINTASIKELSEFPYFRYALAREIVIYRSMKGSIKSAEDLSKIKGFPVEKVSIIDKYLEY